MSTLILREAQRAVGALSQMTDGRQGSLGLVGGFFLLVGAHLALWRVRARSRRALARLTPDELQDVGLTAAQAREEAQKPFWR